MAKLNVVKPIVKSKRVIRLDECDYGALVKINGDYCIVINHNFIGQDNDDTAVLDIETGEILFLSDNSPVKVYKGELSIDEEQFIEFK